MGESGRREPSSMPAADSLALVVGTWPRCQDVHVREEDARELRLMAHLAADELEDARRELGSLRADLARERSHSAALERTIAVMRRAGWPAADYEAE